MRGLIKRKVSKHNNCFDIDNKTIDIEATALSNLIWLLIPTQTLSSSFSTHWLFGEWTKIGIQQHKMVSHCVFSIFIWKHCFLQPVPLRLKISQVGNDNSCSLACVDVWTLVHTATLMISLLACVDVWTLVHTATLMISMCLVLSTEVKIATCNREFWRPQKFYSILFYTHTWCRRRRNN